MIDRQATAVAFYGEQADQQPDPPPSERDPQQALADALYSQPQVEPIQPPDVIRELRAGDDSRALFDAQGMYRGSMPDSQLDEYDVPEDKRPAIMNEAREMAMDLGLEDSDLQTLQAAGNAIMAEPVTEDTRDTWRAQAYERLREVYGDGAERALKDAAQLVQRDPRIARVLAQGAGDHPDVVMTFANLARKARGRGQLQDG